MPFGTKDIGGGLQSLQYEQKAPSAGGQLEQAKDYLGLVDLGNRIQAAPVEQAMREAELAVKENQKAQIPIQNAIAGMQLYTAQQGEGRAQKTFFNEQVKNIHEMLGQSVEMGNAALKETFGPTAGAVKNADGTIVAKIGNKSFVLDPENKIADPVKRQQVTGNYRQDWVNSTKDFQLKSQAFRNLKSNVGLATGAGDVATLYNFIKIIEPGIAGAVREGEIALGQATTSMGQQFLNLYNKQVQNPNAPIFGASDSLQRKNFLQTASTIESGLRQDTVEQAKFYKYVAERNHLDPTQIVQPVGGLSYAELTGDPPADDDGGASAKLTGTKSTEQSKSKGGKTPIEASVVPSKKEAEAARFKSLNDLMPQLFVLPEGR